MSRTRTIFTLVSIIILVSMVVCGSDETPEVSAPTEASQPTPTTEPTSTPQPSPTVAPSPSPTPAPAVTADLVPFQDEFGISTLYHPADYSLEGSPEDMGDYAYALSNADESAGILVSFFISDEPISDAEWNEAVQSSDIISSIGRDIGISDFAELDRQTGEAGEHILILEAESEDNQLHGLIYLEESEEVLVRVVALVPRAEWPDQEAVARQVIADFTWSPDQARAALVKETASALGDTLPASIKFERYEHNMDCTGYNEKLLLRTFSVLYPSGSVITDCQGNPDNYVQFELDPDEEQEDAAFVFVLGRFELDPPDKSYYMSAGTEFLTLFSDQLKAQLQGEEMDLTADSIVHQDNIVLHKDLAGEIEGIPRLLRVATIPNFEHGQGLLFMAIQKTEAAPEEAFPAFDELTRKIIGSVEFPPAQPVIGSITFATDLADDGKPLDPSDSFPLGVTRVYGVFEYADLFPGMAFGYNWYIDGQEVLSDVATWDDEPAGVTWVNIDHSDGLPAGKYEVQLTVDGEVVQTGSFVIGDASAN